ncbi:MAG: RNA 2',3'-cyclic phosphodiesterase [Candidatus Hydrogenedentota bacterium]
MMRAFLAIVLPDSISHYIWHHTESLRSVKGISWVPPERMHLTLRFMADASFQQMENLILKFASGISDVHTFDIEVRKLGAFPSTHRPSVIWAGIETDGEELATIQSVAELAAQSEGFEPDDRPFTPHVTLGRVRSAVAGKSLQPMFSRIAPLACGSISVTAVSLFSSELTRSGPTYTRLHTLELKP